MGEHTDAELRQSRLAQFWQHLAAKALVLVQHLAAKALVLVNPTELENEIFWLFVFELFLTF